MKTLPKEFSNRAYQKAKTLRYSDFVTWWDAQKIEKEPIKMKFIDAPVGARFKFINHENKSIWVKISSLTPDGLIAKWNGNVDAHQAFCSFVHEEIGIDFDTVVELV